MLFLRKITGFHNHSWVGVVAAGEFRDSIQQRGCIGGVYFGRGFVGSIVTVVGVVSGEDWRVS